MNWNLNAEIDELNIELENKKEEINKLKLYATKLKHEKKNLEDKRDTKIDYDKALWVNWMIYLIKLKKKK